jgi:hypothetical protein
MGAMVRPVRETRAALELESPLWNILGCDWRAWTRLSGGREEGMSCLTAKVIVEDGVRNVGKKNKFVGVPDIDFPLVGLGSTVCWFASPKFI